MVKCGLIVPKISSTDEKIKINAFPTEGTTVKMEIAKLNYETWVSEVVYSDTQISDRLGYVIFEGFPKVSSGKTITFIATNPNCKKFTTTLTVE